MVIRGHSRDQPRRGRRPGGTAPIDPWLLALDAAEPADTRRRERFLEALRRAPNAERGGRSLTWSQKSLADAIGITARQMNTYVIADPARPGVLDPAQRRQLATLLCGADLHEPWLSHGRWSAPDGTCLAPRWLTDLGMVDQLRWVAYWSALAHLRALAAGVGGDHRLITLLPHDSPWIGFQPSRNAGTSLRPWPSDMYQRFLAVELSAEPDRAARFLHIIAICHGADFNHLALWRFAPDRLHAAASEISRPSDPDRSRSSAL